MECETWAESEAEGHLMMRAPSAAKCRLLQESLWAEKEAVSRGVAPEQSSRRMPPVMRPAATIFCQGWKLQSCSRDPPSEFQFSYVALAEHWHPPADHPPTGLDCVHFTVRTVWVTDWVR